MNSRAPFEENLAENTNNLAAEKVSTLDDAGATTYSRFKEWRLRHSFLSLIFEVAVLVIFVVVPFRTFVAQPFIVSGESMLPTFHNNNYLIINQLEKRLGGDLDRYDVVVFKYPGDETKYYIKRIIGLPGEQVVVEDGKTFIYSQTEPDGLEIRDDYITGKTIGRSDITLADDQYFVMGDNRENSSDSRFWGALPEENIVGSPIIRMLPFAEISLKPGDVTP